VCGGASSCVFLLRYSVSLLKVIKVSIGVKATQRKKNEQEGETGRKKGKIVSSEKQKRDCSV